MSAASVTDEQIQDFKRLFPASRHLATALEESRKEVASLRRQLEEQVVVPELRWGEIDELWIESVSDPDETRKQAFFRGARETNSWWLRNLPRPSPVTSTDMVTVPREKCEWSPIELGSDWYQTSCGHEFIFSDGDGPEETLEHGFKFCCYCGCALRSGEAGKGAG